MTEKRAFESGVGIPDAIRRHYDAFSARDFDAAVEPLTASAVLSFAEETGATTIIATGREEIAGYMRYSFLSAIYTAAPLMASSDEATPVIDVAWTSVSPLDGRLQRGRSRIAFTLVDGLIDRIHIESNITRR
ncbi:nuclear transport factor 2 family protein [Microbacterium sp. 18062]|uniref:nuclear transport factor 2 family protein n=1 Tax=Microbacterium sp. 18062 TaxID=2681410 RepID=UPI0013568669|nr:nuclear transport factor 2 family protein [Microbacterium sp. 18062]